MGIVPGNRWYARDEAFFHEMEEKKAEELVIQIAIAIDFDGAEGDRQRLRALTMSTRKRGNSAR